MGIRVLLVDDEKEFTGLLSERLTIRGFIVTTASSGVEAISKIKENSVDVIIMDVLMPGINGIETFNELKKIHPPLCVIMLTGHAELDTAMVGMETGIFDYLIKPVDIEELVEKIKLAYKYKQMSEKRTKTEAD
ncbi:response regulator [bacterium]|nr:response regulator [bacterium]